MGTFTDQHRARDVLPRVLGRLNRRWAVVPVHGVQLLQRQLFCHSKWPVPVVVLLWVGGGESALWRPRRSRFHLTLDITPSNLGMDWPPTDGIDYYSSAPVAL